MDDVTWGALTLSLTVLCGLWTWHAFRRRGLVSGLRGVALTLLPLAAYLTRTLRMFTRIVEAITDWATGLAFSPTVWLGVLLAGASVALFVVTGAIGSRGGGRKHADTAAETRPGLPAAGKGRPPAADDDFAEIEALLRKRGIR